jgi:hypothetical protein
MKFCSWKTDLTGAAKRPTSSVISWSFSTLRMRFSILSSRSDGRHRHRSSSGRRRRSPPWWRPCRYAASARIGGSSCRVSRPAIHPRRRASPSAAIHHQVHGLATSVDAGARSRHVQRLRPPADGGVLGNRQGETEKANDRADQALRLAQREMEHRFQRQRRQDRQRRIPSLPASGCPGRGSPGPLSPRR